MFPQLTNVLFLFFPSRTLSLLSLSCSSFLSSYCHLFFRYIFSFSLTLSPFFSPSPSVPSPSRPSLGNEGLRGCLCVFVPCRAALLTLVGAEEFPAACGRWWLLNQGTNPRKMRPRPRIHKDQASFPHKVPLGDVPKNSRFRPRSSLVPRTPARH